MEIFNLNNYLLSFQVRTTPEVDICSSTWSCRTAFTIISRRTWCSAIDNKPSSIGINNSRAKYQRWLTSTTNIVITIPETNKRNLRLNTNNIPRKYNYVTKSLVYLIIHPHYKLTMCCFTIPQSNQQQIFVRWYLLLLHVLVTVTEIRLTLFPNTSVSVFIAKTWGL